jgi:hypothetical protein
MSQLFYTNLQDISHQFHQKLNIDHYQHLKQQQQHHYPCEILVKQSLTWTHYYKLYDPEIYQHHRL